MMVPYIKMLLAALLTPTVVCLSQVTSWERTSGPYGGSVLCLVNDASGPMYAGTSGGLFVSTDGGGRWDFRSASLVDVAAGSFTIGPHGYWFVGSGTRRAIYRSTDNGITWSSNDIDTGLADGYVNCLGFDTSNGNLFAGLYLGGIYRSSDDGGSWTKSGLQNATVRCLAMAGNGIILAGGAGGLSISTDGGTAWTAVAQATGSVRSLTIGPARQIYAGTAAGRVYRSTDSGSSWSWTVADSTHSIQALAADSGGRLYAGSSGGGVVQSTDDGATWSRGGANPPSLYALSLLSRNDVLFVGTSGGLFRSTDHAETWSDGSAGITATAIQSLGRSLNGGILAGTTGSGAYWSTDEGTSWFPAITDSAMPTVYAFATHGNGTIFAGTNLWLHRSTDNGASWEQVNGAGARFARSLVTSLAFDTGGVLYAAAGRPYRSTNIGQSWSEVSLGISGGTDVSCLTVDRSNHVYAGTSGDGFSTFADGVYRLADNGAGWSRLGAGLAGKNILSLLASGDSILLVGVQSGGMYRSTNGGGSWLAATLGDASLSVSALVLATPGQIFAGTNHGIYRSEDDGLTWAATTAGLTTFATRALIEGAGGLFFAGTDGGGIFRSALFITAASEGRDMPGGYVLHQNFPNPFNPQTTITYAFPASGQVRLSVYNVLGQEVATLVNEYQGPGFKTIAFDASRLPSGVYAYRITAGTFTDVKKMVLIK